MSAVLDTPAILRAYRRYARWYDCLFGRMLQAGRREAVRAAGCRPGDRILEVGVGTGLSLPLYPRETRVVGIDISAEMLVVARRRIAAEGLCQVSLREMDVRDLEFPDAAFDKVVCMYVASVVPNLQEMLKELKRVCRPDGSLLFLNHFLGGNRIMRRLELTFAPLAGVVGFNSSLSREPLLGDRDLELTSARRVNIFGYWTLLEFRNGFGRKTQAGGG